VFSVGQAERIGLDHCGGDGNFDIWSLTVDQRQCPLRVEEHPDWCGMSAFKEVLVPDAVAGPAQVQLHKRGQNR